MKKYWFKAKKYGWGWYPSSWQGWSILLLFIIMEVLLFIKLDSHSVSVNQTLISFIPLSIILVVKLIIICYLTGEKPRWRWGK